MDIYSKYPELASVPSHEVYSVIELLTIKTKTRDTMPHPLPYNCPMVFRRAAIKKALGMFKSWQTSYQSWQNKCDLKRKKAAQKGKKAKLPRPSLLPRKFNSPVTLYKGMYKEDIGGSIMLKLWTGSSWAWVKHRYLDYKLSDEWVKSSPTLVIKDNIITLNWCYEKLVKSNGKIPAQIKENGGLKVCSVDLNLDGDIAVCSILSVEGTGRVTENDKLFVKGNKRHQRLRKRLLGKDAVAKSKTNSSETLNNANAQIWRKLKNREKYEAERVSRRIVDFAQRNGATVIVFEHLSNLKPNKAKYSRRSNQKRAYWLKSKIYQRVKDKALNDYGIYTVRVSPKGTSREFAYTGEPILRGYQKKNEMYFSLKGMGSLILTEDGLIGHCDLNSSRNIGLRYLSKHYEKPNLVTERFDKIAKPPTPNRMASILLKGGGNPCDFPTLLRSHISGNYVTEQARYADRGESEKLYFTPFYYDLDVSQSLLAIYILSKFMIYSQKRSLLGHRFAWKQSAASGTDPEMLWSTSMPMITLSRFGVYPAEGVLRLRELFPVAKGQGAVPTPPNNFAIRLRFPHPLEVIPSPIPGLLF